MLGQELNTIYYETNFKKNYFIETWKVFNIYEDFNELYSTIIENIEGNKNNIKIEFNQDDMKLIFLVILFSTKKKKENKIELNLKKRKINIDSISEKLISKFVDFQENQNQYNEKIK